MQQVADPGLRRNVVLLSDGTGNSAGKLLKTNVWRLYQALDLREGTAQIACYNDGVGTSSFRPFALLGGAFGWGLKRNILHLYEFLSRNYQPGDRLFLFGFSRGAFTVRLLAGLILSQGIVRAPEAELRHYTREAYRAYRRGAAVPPPAIVRVMRLVRDAGVRIIRRVRGLRPYTPAKCDRPDGIEFIGVWDTVAAYGTPFVELTRGIDQYVWPLSMPDYILRPQVRTARQALALDDERETFHPLLWDEERSERPERIRQVWFSGMHADVGGGYADDALSREPLLWMMQEAGKQELRFRDGAIVSEPPFASRSAPLHDSRLGLAAYYRYQPRRIGAWLRQPDADTRAMRGPRNAYGVLDRVLLHASAAQRIADATDGYAPLVVPREFRVLQPCGAVTRPPESEAEAERRIRATEQVWNEVWKKRCFYFLSVLTSLALASMPLWGLAQLACEGPLCLASPVIRLLGGFLPGFASPWIDTYAAHPALFAAGAALLALLLFRSSAMERRIQDRMRPLWSAGGGAAVRAPGALDRWIAGLRTSRAYQAAVYRLKWQVLPFVFGGGILALIALGVLAGGAVVAGRVWLAFAEPAGRVCDIGGTGGTGGTGGGDTATGRRLDIAKLCQRTGIPLQAGHRYLVLLHVVTPWRDGGVPATPLGFGSSEGSLAHLLGVPFRRALGGNWLQPYASVGPEGGPFAAQPLEMRFAGSDTFEAVLVPKLSGMLTLWVNDAVMPGRTRLFTDGYYRNNEGSADVAVRELPAAASSRP